MEEELHNEEIKIRMFQRAMHFLRCYPKTEHGRDMVASEKGAVDPKT